MYGYVHEMFPLSGHLSIALLSGLAIAGFTAKVQGLSSLLLPASVASATWNIFAVLFTLRLMDELKDKDIDRQLFPDRPLPSGRVLESDIRLSLLAVTMLYLLSNMRSVPVVASAIVVFGYTLLMFKRFFAPTLLRKSLLITLMTHTPIVPLIWIQAFITVTQMENVSLASVKWNAIAMFVAMEWLAMIGWEVSRKIRSAEEETEYVTYSQIFGSIGAVLVVWTAQSVSAAIGVYFYYTYQLNLAYLILLVAGWITCCGGYARFVMRPSPRTSKLRSYGAVFVFAISSAQVFGFTLSLL